MRSYILFFLIIINIPCFGGPSIDRNLLHDPYSHDIARITEYYYYITGGLFSETQREFIEIQNGLFIVEENMIVNNPNGTRSDSFRGIICYNIYHNNQHTTSEIRLMEIIRIYHNYEINHIENGIEILANRAKRIRDEGGYPAWAEQQVKILFEFDEFNKIDRYKIFNQHDNELEEEYLFHYNNDGNLDSIYSIHDWGNVLCKSIYYDGELRTLERPFFNDLQRINLDEIIVLENNKLKYHSKRDFYNFFSFDHQPTVSEDFLTNDEHHISYFIEFDEKGEINKFTLHLITGENEPYNFQYLQYDERGNWILMRRRVEEYRREIEYRK